MPSNLLMSNRSFDREESVLAYGEPQAYLMKTIDTSKITADADSQKILKAGTFIQSIAGSSYGRPLARTTLAAATSTSSTSVTVANARNFVAGDVLVCPVPQASLTFAGTWANGDTVILTIGGQNSATYTVSGFTTLTALAATVAAFINSDSTINKYVYAFSSGAVVYVYSITGFPYTIARTINSTGGGTLAITGSATNLQINTAVGTIAASGVNATTNVLTLTGNAAVVLPAGMPIGVAGAEILGITLSPIDLLMTSNDVAIYHDCAVWQDRLPYYDGSIKAALPQLVLARV